MICSGCGREYRGASTRSGTPRCPYCDRPYALGAQTGATRVDPVIMYDQRAVYLPDPRAHQPFYLKRIYEAPAAPRAADLNDAQILAMIIG